MPNNKFDSKSFNAEAFKYMVARVPNLNMNEIKKSRALAANPDIQEVFSGQNGTAYARLAMRGLIDGDAVNYDGSTDITATSTKTFEQGVVVVGRAKAWKERDFSYDVTGGVDFMANISEQVAQYKDELDEATILSILKGIFAMSTADAKNKEFVEKHTTTVSGAMTATTLNTAANKACGANKKKFTLVFCHSDVSTGLENLNLIERLKYTDKDGIQRDLELGTWNGKLVIVTDQMPVSEGYFDADANTDGALKIIASGAPADGEILLSKVTPYFGSKTLAANDYVVAGVQYTTYATMKLNLLIDEETGENFSYESSIDEQTYNKIKLAYNNEKTGKRELFIAQDGSKMNQWGVLQYFEEVQTKTGASAKADALLKLYDQKTRKLTIQNAFGDVRVRAGSAVVVALNLGDIVTNNYMVVNKVTHTFRGDEHMMELDLIGGEFIA